MTGENGFEKTVGVFRRSKCLFVRGSSGREARVPSHRLEARFVRPEVGAVRVVRALVFGDELLELGVILERDMVLRFTVLDVPPDSIVEGGLDAVSVTVPGCP